VEVGQDLSCGNRTIGSKSGMVIGLRLLKHTHETRFRAKTRVESLEIDTMGKFQSLFKTHSRSNQVTQRLTHGVHMNEFMLVRLNGRKPQVLQDMAVESHIGIFGIKEHPVTVKSDNLERSESVQWLNV